MKYYSNISHSVVDECEALKQIIDFCNEWKKLSNRSIKLDTYLRKHAEIIDISQWNCFHPVK